MKKQFFGAALVSLFAFPASAGEAWDNLRSQLFGERPLKAADHVIAIDAPYRTQDDARTQIAAQIVAPRGLRVGTVTVVLDENPMPVSAVFALDDPQASFYFDVTMRVNGPTPLHVVAETTDGQLFVAETFVKTSGQGACSAPPGSDPEAALASLGNMTLDVGSAVPLLSADALASLEARFRKLNVDIQHPSHSGMQMDQISLLFIPLRYVEKVEIDLDGGGYVDMTGSISLSENPRVSLSVPGQTQSVDVTMTDTNGTVSHEHKRIAGF
ncbi:quinoprotein dehydrogenase-associated SoxYZ-like carrier [Roseovarius aestuariivivens]|uniref:quinoprotein dehydrogenase-associated SoxYZ-like carrier n=1 Tax=Roseovarius aestuariivivens TaxID=1888910 RepID=UPI0010801BBF|nr:quinoprotein dehydrogenase-associated SoxYZ-like carrier [Roseovarius aestuariivivens]